MIKRPFYTGIPDKLISHAPLDLDTGSKTIGPLPSPSADTASPIPNPIVIEQTPRGERQYDIYSRLLIDRIIFLGSEIDDIISNSLIAQMFFLESSDPEKDIHFYINSPGGQLSAALGMYDVMQFVKCDISTYCIGQAAGTASILLTAGKKGKRFSLPNSRIMIRQPMGGAEGQATDMAIQAKEILYLRDRLNSILSHHTHRDLQELKKDTEREKYFSADEAVKYGLIDQVVSQHSSVKEAELLHAKE